MMPEVFKATFPTDEERMNAPDGTAMRRDDMPEAPMHGMMDDKQYLDVIKHYVDASDNIPEDLRQNNWSMFDKNFVYSFMEEKESVMVDIFSTILRCDTQMSMPSHKLTFKMLQDLDNMMINSYFIYKRAKGTTANVKNERSLQVTQIAQSISTVAGMQNKKTMPGMFQRIKSLFG
jgi:hypothetical protein